LFARFILCFAHTSFFPKKNTESLIRLAEARARSELRETVTAADAVDVVSIMKESLFDVFSDADGQLDFSRAVGVENGLLTFICFLCTLRTQISRSICTVKHNRRERPSRSSSAPSWPRYRLVRA
jgi:hypothetical protein